MLRSARLAAGLALSTALATAPVRAQDVSPEYLREAQALFANPAIANAMQLAEEFDAWSLARLIELTEIPAPPFMEKARGERFAEMLTELGADSVWTDAEGNVIGLRRGRDGSRTVGFGGHLDTVFPEGTDVTVRQRGDTLYAPGIGDDTRGLVVVLTVLRALEVANIETAQDLWFVGVVGEEGLGDLRGMKHIFRPGAEWPDVWIDVDGGGLTRLVTMGLGSVRYRVTFRGPGGHSWGAFGLANPAHAMSRAVARFQDAADILTRSGPRTSYNVGVVGGGTSVNSIPFETSMEVDMRSESPESLARIEQAFLTAMDRGLAEENALRRRGEALTVEKLKIGDRPSGEGDPTTPLVQRALAATSLFGVEGSLARSSTDSNIPISLGVPAVTIGRGGEGGNAHAPDEWWINEDGHLAIQRALLPRVVRGLLRLPSGPLPPDRSPVVRRRRGMLPEIIQGGMGVGVSGWALAYAVSTQGQLGVVSGTALDATLVRRLWNGDEGGHLRRAMEAFPLPEVSSEVLERFFRPVGSDPREPYPLLPLHRRCLDAVQQRLIALANFVEVFLAKEGHDGPVGINYLHKIQIPTLPSLYGAILAGVDYVLMGAGIPRDVPGALDRLAEHKPASIRFDVRGGTGEADEVLEFDPRAVGFGDDAPLERPRFLPIVSSHSLATVLARKANGEVNGFVVEGPTAGGHNAPPRDGHAVNDRGELVYGERDQARLDKVAALGLPFWVAGGAGRPERLRAAKAAGATGVQIGTLFAYCDESGLREDLKQGVLARARNGDIDVLTDGRASPTGFPFKAVSLAHSLSDEAVYERRVRVCDLGYLRTPYRREDGRIGYRCPSEPVDTYLKKDGDRADVAGRKCLCNALCANIGLGQMRPEGDPEPPLLTSGDDLRELGSFLGDRAAYSAKDVIGHVLGETV